MPVVDVPGLGSVEFPDGMTNADMEKAISRTLANKHGQMALEGTSALERGLIGAGKAFTDLGQGARQLYAKAADVVDPRRPSLSSLVTGKTVPSRYEELEREVAEKRAADAAVMDTTAGKVGNFAGAVAATVPTMFIPGVNTYTGAGLVGGAMGLLQPTGDGESRTANTALGAAGGLLGQAAGRAISRVVRPVQTTLSASEARLAAEAARRNIPLTAGQATGSRPLQVTESVMENLPFTSGPQLAQRHAQQTAFNRAVGETFGSPADALTPDVLGAARNRIGQEFTNLSGRNTLQANQGMVQQLGTIQQQVNRYATPDVARVVNNNIDDVLSKIEPGDIMPGRSYRELDSQIGRITRGAQSGDVRHYLGQVRDTLRTAMDQSISQTDRNAWQQARREYANLMTVAPLAAKNEAGDISGRTLLNVANQANRNAKFGAPSELAELGRIGRAFVADGVPNSGTAQRQLTQSLLTSGAGSIVGGAGAAATGNNPLEGAALGFGVGAAGLLTPRVVQSVMNSQAGQAYLRHGLLNLSPAEMAAINALARSGTVGAIGYAGQ